MSTSRFSRVQKATALVPLALLSTAWTASLVGLGGVSTVAAASDPDASMPGATSVPTDAIEAPASVTVDGVIAPSVPAGQAATIVRTASTNGIPSAALAAYQRAAAVINAADTTCNLSWQLIAAIGRVESDHGRFGGNVLDDDGVARPGIYGIPLDGTNGTRAISDTDAGQYDNDQVWDRAVGPMQFIPSTWSVVGVDADGDGVRDPQNIHDASLAAAVYLCSGDDDLSAVEGQRSAVFRYNRSNEYVDLVLSIMNAYLQGDFSSVPNSTVSASSIGRDLSSPLRPVTKTKDRGTLNAPTKTRPNGPTTSNTPTTGTTPPSTGGGTGTGGGSNDGGNGGGGLLPGTGGGSKDKGTNGVGDVLKDPVKQLEETLTDPVGEVTETLTWAQAQAQCLLEGITLLEVGKLTRCIQDLLGG